MALHAEVLAKREAVVRAVRVLQHARGAGRNAEGLAVPVEGKERLQLAEPFARHLVVRHAHLAPADLLHRIRAHAPAERLGDELAAEAMTEEWHVLAHGVADQVDRPPAPR